MSPRHSTTPSSVSAHERPPRLVPLFAVLTALGVAAAAAVILMVVRQTDVVQAQQPAIDRARFAARAVLAPELQPSDLEGAVSTERRRQLDRLMRGRMLLEGIRAATLYGSDGRLVYAVAGRYASGAATAEQVRDALSGTTVSEIARARDGSRALRTYVPLADVEGRVKGVVRLDQEYEPIAAMVRRSSLLIAGVLEGLLLLLFLALVPVLARASSRIRTHLAELEHAATHDDLTGMPNRYGFRRIAGAALREREAATIMLVDLDGFSEINSSLGAESGDRLLSDVGARLERELAPDGALVGRLGEDEFGVLHGADDAAGAEWVAERIRHSFAAPFVVDGVRVAVDVDVGIGLFPVHGPDIETVLDRASAALTAAKAEGRSSVQIYEPDLGAGDRCRLAVVADLRDALKKGQLRVHYQPQTDLMTHRIRGVEALLRWEHPERGLLTASEFVAHGERGGLAQELRRFVVSTATRQWQEWHELGLDLEVAVNLSAVDMLDPALPDEIEEAMDRHGIPPWSLVLELTERTLIGDERRMRHVIDRLERIGVRLAVDDFGTGYSSLASLRTFPIHQVKLDRSLLADVPGDEAAEAIVGGSIEIAHGLGALVVAEGIETLEQWRFVSTMGCDIAQGYLVGKPAPPETILELFDAPRLVPLRVA
jgi:diguanylate cyclase (GGDEF)-like protein